MRNKKLIIEIYEELDKLLENAPNEEELEDKELIEFYANAKNLKESIERLEFNKESKNDLNCYIADFEVINKENKIQRRIMLFSKDIADAMAMLNDAFIKSEEDYIDYENATFKQVDCEEYGIDCPHKPQFRILCDNNVVL